MLSLLSKHINKNHIGLFRDDSLAILKNTSGPEAGKLKKKFQKFFNLFGTAKAATNGNHRLPKIETTSKVSLKFLSRINLGRRGARAELSTLDTAHNPVPPPPRPPPVRHSSEMVERVKEQYLDIIFQYNLKITNYLDITLNLNDASYRPYRKPNEETNYIHANSDHSQSIIIKKFNDQLKNETQFCYHQKTFLRGQPFTMKNA